MDFVTDMVLDGRRFRALTVVDNWSRHSQLIEPDFTLTGTKVVAALERVAKRTGYPHMSPWTTEANLRPRRSTLGLMSMA